MDCQWIFNGFSMDFQWNFLVVAVAAAAATGRQAGRQVLAAPGSASDEPFRHVGPWAREDW